MAETERRELADGAPASQKRAAGVHRTDGEARIRELEDEVERFRRASEDALQQLDWCIGYMHGSGKKGIAKSLAKNRALHPHASVEAGGTASAQSTDRRRLTCITARTADKR